MRIFYNIRGGRSCVRKQTARQRTECAHTPAAPIMFERNCSWHREWQCVAEMSSCVGRRRRFRILYF
jgi:hypothetical protein